MSSIMFACILFHRVCLPWLKTAISIIYQTHVRSNWLFSQNVIDNDFLSYFLRLGSKINKTKLSVWTNMTNMFVWSLTPSSGYTCRLNPGIFPLTFSSEKYLKIIKTLTTECCKWNFGQASYCYSAREACSLDDPRFHLFVHPSE